MKIKWPKTIDVVSYKFNVKKDDKSYAASFDFSESRLTIGTKALKEGDTDWVFMLLCHELFEICCVANNVRYKDGSVEGDYKFFLNHKEMENVMNLFASVIKQFIE